MAIKVPAIGDVTSLWSTRSVAAAPQYKSGVAGAGQAWQSGVDGAQDNWSSGVMAAAGNNAYRTGTAGKAGHYVDKATNLGATRFAGGVQAATNAYQSGMGKVLAVIGQVSLPPRMATGSNQGRSSAVADMLHQAKLSGQI